MMRCGRKRACGSVVAYVLMPEGALNDCSVAESRLGLIVSKAVGSAVTRNRVKRRLRHLIRPRMAVFPAGTGVVVRALAAAAGASSAELSRDLDSALFGVVPKATPR